MSLHTICQASTRVHCCHIRCCDRPPLQRGATDAAQARLHSPCWLHAPPALLCSAPSCPDAITLRAAAPPHSMLPCCCALKCHLMACCHALLLCLTDVRCSTRSCSYALLMCAAAPFHALTQSCRALQRPLMLYLVLLCAATHTYAPMPSCCALQCTLMPCCHAAVPLAPPHALVPYCFALQRPLMP
jgi:hypothetical protein